MGKYTIYVLAILACLLAGCSGRQSSVSQLSGAALQTGVEQLPAATELDSELSEQLAFPPPSTLRQSSYIETDLYIEGSDFVTEYPNLNTTAYDTDAGFTPTWNSAAPANDSLAYAMYQFGLTGYEREETLHVFWKQQHDAADCWIGAANWDLDQWDWFSLPESGPINLDFASHQYFPGGKIVIAVVVADDQSWTLDYLRIGELLDTLEPPQDVQASDGTDTRQVVVSWTRSEGAVGYKLYRDDQGNQLASVGDVDSYNDTDTAWNEEHTYWLKAFNTIAESDFSASDTGWRAEGPPDPPTDVQASDGLSTTYIEVTWTKSVGATGYAVYYDNPALKKVELGDVDVWQDNLVYNTNPHEYWVAAINAHGIGDQSESDTGYLADPSDPPGIPTNLEATDDEYNDRIVLTWTKAKAAMGYYVYRDSQVDHYAEVFDTDTWTDFSVPDTDQHQYWLTAYNPNGESDFSEPDFGSRTEPITPGAPTDLAATDGDYNDKIVLTWTKDPDSVSYNIYRGLTSVKYAEDIGDVDTWEDTMVEMGGSDHTYNYWVSGISIDDIEGPLSDPDTGWREEQIPDPPTDVAASDGDYNDKIVLTWTKSDGASGYKIYRDVMTNMVGEVGDVDTWSDLYVPDCGSENTYEYWIKAVGPDGDSGFSASDTGWRAPNPPDPPTELEATDGTFSDRIRLTWTKSDGATGYEIYRDDTSGDPYETVGDIDSWDDIFLVPDYDTHIYWLKAFNNDGKSDFSDWDSGYAEE